VVVVRHHRRALLVMPGSRARNLSTVAGSSYLSPPFPPKRRVRQPAKILLPPRLAPPRLPKHRALRPCFRARQSAERFVPASAPPPPPPRHLGGAAPVDALAPLTGVSEAGGFHFERTHAKAPA
jgi:hypothetical protein